MTLVIIHSALGFHASHYFVGNRCDIFLMDFPAICHFFLSWKAFGPAKTSANADGRVCVVFLFF